MAINDPNQPQQTSNQPRQLGTGFTNLQNIMQANTGNKLGQAVSGGIQQTGQQVSSQLDPNNPNSAVGQFNKQSQANAMGTQSQKQDVQNTLTNIGNLDPTQQQTANANFANYRSGQYTGPTDIANISNIQNQAQNAQQQGQEVGTAGGRQALLQQYAANPGSSYGSGAQNLDSLLLGSTGGKQLQQARQSVSGLNNQVNAAQTTAQQQGQQLTNQAQGFGQQVTGQVQGAQSAIMNQANSDATKANAANQLAYTNEQKAIQAAQSGNLSTTALQALDLTSGQRTYGVNVGQYLGYDQNGQQITNPNQLQQATAFNVMAQPQFKQYTGLQQLMGQTPTATQGPAYQAGQATYDQARAQATIQSAQQPLQQSQAALQQAQQDFNQANNVYRALFAAGRGNAGKSNNDAAQARLAAAQQAYTNLNNQLGGTISATDAYTPQTIPGVS